jgi:hypothetical protein
LRDTPTQVTFVEAIKMRSVNEWCFFIERIFIADQQTLCIVSTCVKNNKGLLPVSVE